MFNRVLIGVDGQQGGRDAIALAKRLRDLQGEFVLAHVYPGDRVISRGSSPAYDAAQHEDGLALLEEQRQSAGIEAELRPVGSSSVGRGLHVLAESIHADLLVIGSSQHGLLGRVFLGDDTRAALNGAPCAVAIAPTGYEQEPSAMREIGVAYNESPESQHALQVARELAAQSGAKLSAFEAIALPAYTFMAGPGMLADTVEKTVEDARARVAQLGDVEPHAAYGVPADELAVYSASIDLLVVGSRDYGPVGRLMHGSTSRALARLARCPLLVLTRAARSAGLGVDEPVLERVPDEL